MADKVFRIGHLGECNELALLGALSGVELGLAAAGVPHRRNRGLLMLYLLDPAKAKGAAVKTSAAD